MPEVNMFEGFTRKTIKFLERLAENNNRAWFESQREDYEKHVLEPAKAFVRAMGARLRPAVPNIIAVPRINKSLFRISRDTRFSLDKSPYKTNLGVYFWEGIRSRMECPGFYFHVEPPKIVLGAGMYIFPDLLMDRFRRAAVHPRLGKELSGIIRQASQVKGFELGGKHYKRIPAGCDPLHPNAELLLHRGLHFGQESDIPEELFSARIIDYCWERFKPFVPLHRWLVALTAY